MWFSAFAENSNGFSDLISDAVFRFFLFVLFRFRFLFDLSGNYAPPLIIERNTWQTNWNIVGIPRGFTLLLITGIWKCIGLDSFASRFWFWSNFFGVFRFWMIIFYGSAVSNRPRCPASYSHDLHALTHNSDQLLISPCNITSQSNERWWNNHQIKSFTGYKRSKVILQSVIYCRIR